jgi:hypothetical protein
VYIESEHDRQVSSFFFLSFFLSLTFTSTKNQLKNKLKEKKEIKQFLSGDYNKWIILVRNFHYSNCRNHFKGSFVFPMETSFKYRKRHLFLTQEVFTSILILSGLNYDAFETSRRDLVSLFYWFLNNFLPSFFRCVF